MIASTLDRAKQRKRDPMREVIGTLADGVIYQDVRSGEPVTRARMKFMAALDLGPKWAEWAKAPTLYLLPKT